MTKERVWIAIFLYSISFVVLIGSGESYLSSILWPLVVVPLLWLYIAADDFHAMSIDEPETKLGPTQTGSGAKSAIVGLLVFGLPLLGVFIYHYYKNA
jgi:hypothetical protein